MDTKLKMAVTWLLVVISTFACTTAKQNTAPDGDMPKFAIVKKAGKWGLYKIGSGMVIPPTYKRSRDLSGLHEGLIRIKDSLSAGYGYYNARLEKQFTVPYTFADVFYGDYALYTNGARRGFINKQGESVFESVEETSLLTPVEDKVLIKSTESFEISDSRVGIKITYTVHDLKYGAVYTLPDTIQRADLVNGKLLRVQTNDYWGIYNFIDEQYVIQPTYEDIIAYHNLVRFPVAFDYRHTILLGDKDSVSTLFDEKGKVLYSGPTIDIQPFSENKAVFSQNDGLGVINMDGEILIPAIYDNNLLYYAKKGNYFGFMKDGKWGVVDIKNKVIVPFKYKELQVLNDHLFIFKEGNSYGLKNMSEGTILEPTYDLLFVVSSGDYIRAEIDGKQGLLDYQGNIVVPLEFEEVY